MRNAYALGPRLSRKAKPGFILSEEVVEGRVYGVVGARGLRPIESQAKKSVAHAPPAFSAVDFWGVFLGAPSGACVRGCFLPPLATSAAAAAAAAARASSAVHAIADTTVAILSCALETVSG